MYVPSHATDDDLMRLSEAHPGWRFERDDNGATIVSPNSTEGGAQSGEAFGQLYLHARREGGRAYDSSTGFTMSTGAVRSPDAAWLSAERTAALSRDAKTGYWRVCPDVVIEVASPSDRWSDVTAKIDMYAREGAVYAVAFDPTTRSVYERGIPPAGLTLDADAIFDA